MGPVVTWNGTLAPGEGARIRITAPVVNGNLGEVVCNQGQLLVPNASPVTDDPQLPGADDPTCFTLAQGPPEIPALSPPLLALLALGLAVLGWRRVRRH
jgi:hypothetical protein